MTEKDAFNHLIWNVMAVPACIWIIGRRVVSRHGHCAMSMREHIGEQPGFIAMTGQAKGEYTFFGHLKGTPAIALGYATNILVQMWINAHTF